MNKETIHVRPKKKIKKIKITLSVRQLSKQGEEGELSQVRLFLLREEGSSILWAHLRKGNWKSSMALPGVLCSWEVPRLQKLQRFQAEMLVWFATLNLDSLPVMGK